MIRPNATTTPSSALTEVTSGTSWLTGSPRDTASRLTGVGLGACPRPRRLSRPVTTTSHVVPGIAQCLQRNRGRFRRAEEGEAQG